MEFKPTWLYVKRHSVTGLLLFGKTTKHPNSVKGGGRYWRHHLSLYGASYVETVCVRRFKSAKSLSLHLKVFKDRYKIKESREWSNHKDPKTFRPQLINLKNRFHFIYKTTNTLNGMFYIGKHSTKNLNDTYLGSGKILQAAIRKNGEEVFKREILTFCSSEAEAYLLEKAYVAQYLGSPGCYNIVPGGFGYDLEGAREAGRKGRAASSKRGPPKTFSNARGLRTCRTFGLGMFGWTFEQRSTWSRQHNNKDRRWVTDGKVSVALNKDKPVPDGFYPGRNIEGSTYRKGMSCWRKGDLHIFAEEKPGRGFVKGMLKETPTKNFPWWNNGKENKRSFTQPGPDYVRGRLPWTSKQVTCPRCNRTGGETAMRGHHFKNCRWGS